MTFDEIHSLLQKRFPQAVLSVEETKPEKGIKIEPKEILPVIQFLKEETQFETLGDLCAVDYPAQDSFCVVYHMQSYKHKMIIRLKCYLPRKDGVEIQSITSLFKAANWLEREAYDMMGIQFSGHPELRRILCPEDWVGHPLRKDYVTPDYYNGMPVPLYFDDANQSPAGESKTC
jgi:NADH-quinone oxidoreductase subunit C